MTKPRRKRSERFTCYWCSRQLGLRNLHHVQRATDPPRHCCSVCHADPDGVYREIYPGGSTEEAASIATYQRIKMEER